MRKLGLTKRDAIRECKKFWKDVKESRLSKRDFLLSERGKQWDSRYKLDCPLCQYTSQFGDIRCIHCPLVTTYGDTCLHLGFEFDCRPSTCWMEVINGL